MAMEKEFNSDIDFEHFIRMRIAELKQELAKSKLQRTRESLLDSIRHNEWILMQIGGIISDMEH